jgi:hypothetical protein
MKELMFVAIRRLGKNCLSRKNGFAYNIFMREYYGMKTSVYFV